MERKREIKRPRDSGTNVREFLSERNECKICEGVVK